MSKKFTKEELNNIIKDYNNGNGLRPCELADKYNRNASSIINKLKDLGIFKPKVYRFTDEDIAYLKEHYPTDDMSEIEAHFPQTSHQGIIDKAHALGIKRDTDLWIDLWSDEEIKLLKKYYNREDKGKLKDLLPNRTFSAIKCKAEKLGLGYTETWSQNETDLLKEVYSNNPIEVVMSYFPNRTKDAIVNHAHLLGLRAYYYNPWTTEEDNFIRKNWETMPDITIGVKINRSFQSVKTRRQELGLYRRDMSRMTYESLAKYVRGHIQDWKNKSMEFCNYQCVFTGSKEFQIHHLYSLSTMLANVMETYNIRYCADINEYSQEELNFIIEKFNEEQAKYPLGVCVSGNIHILFHRLYGQYNNTPEQWYQFEKDFRNGLYDSII